MSHASDIIVGPILTNDASVLQVLVIVKGELSQFIDGICRIVDKAEGVSAAEVTVVDGVDAVLATIKPLNYDKDLNRVRLFISIKCQDYIFNTTGHRSNEGPSGSYANLIENIEDAHLLVAV